VYGTTVLAEVFDDGALVGAARAGERLVARVNELMTDELRPQRELLGADAALERLVSVSPHVTAQSLGRCKEQGRYESTHFCNLRFVCLFFNGTSALFRLLLPRIEWNKTEKTRQDDM